MDWYRKYRDELYHYGVKGMKWGVRRTKEELRYNKGSIQSIINRRASGIKTKNGLKITAMSDHIGDQASSRKVEAKHIVDALENPIYIRDVRYDKQGRPSQRFVGTNATVNVNPETGIITTTWKTGTRERTKYSKKG